MKVQLKNGILLEIEESLTKMESAGKVDSAILDRISELGNHIEDVKSRWLAVGDTGGFYFYLAARSMEFILGRMEHRFKNSRKNDDNPKIVEDSLALLPAMDRVLEVTQPHEINDQSIREALGRIRELRSMARNVDLIEPLEVSTEGIDRDRMQLGLESLMKRLESPETLHNGA